MDDTTALLLRAARGEQSALTALIQATQVDVWRFCAHLVDPATADDLTQDTYLRAMRSLHRFRGDASARTWLLSIARNACADELRNRSRRRRHEVAGIPMETVEVDDADHLSIGSNLANLYELIATLDHDRREAFVLTQIVGLSYREAAIAAAVPIGTIRSRVARARADLIAALTIPDDPFGRQTG